MVDWSSCKNGYMWNPSTRDCECDKTCGIGEHLDINDCICKEHFIDNLVLSWEDEILNTT